MNRKSTPRIVLTFLLALAMAVPFLTSTRAVKGFAPLPGAIFTTDSTCTGTNVNIFADKGDVYLDGGPAHPGAAGLADGEYYCKVTQPDGTLLGTSVGASDETPITVSGGEFAQCYQLSAILIKASDQTPGYDDTGNAGGEYKVWASTVSTFDESSSKTDNFKVKAKPECEDCGPQDDPTLRVLKFYDANANGINDDGQLIANWKVRIQDGIDLIRFTPVVIILAPDDYRVTEFLPNETNWIPTTPIFVDITLAFNDDKTVSFGNVCLGAGGGLTLGYWSNKNGQAEFNNSSNNVATVCGDPAPATDLALMVALNLVNGAGSQFNPGTYAAFRTWLLSATATNMAYMLSAQLAAMELNVLNNHVNGNSLIYAPGTDSANAQGFATVCAVMAEANASLLAHPNTIAADADRTKQEALKNALDKANNNLNFVQGTPCPFSFTE
jgi:hypothetical protein